MIITRETKLFRPQEYFKPKTTAEVCKLLEKYGDKARVIAGGTDILVDRDPEIEALIDILGLGLAYIKTDKEGVKIGATTTFAAIASAPALGKSPYSALATAARKMGTLQVRNVASIGGNICHALPSADSAVALLALEAKINIAGPSGERVLDIASFFVGVHETALKKGEMVTEIRLPNFPSGTEAVFLKKGRVSTGDLATVNTAVRLTVGTDGNCRDVRIALGAVAPVPFRSKKAEAMLEGRKLKEELIGQAAELAAEETKPISDVRSSAEYRKVLSRILVERALKELTTRTAR